MKFPLKLKKLAEYPPEICGVTGCKSDSDVILLDIPLCDKHWLKYCEKKERETYANQHQSKENIGNSSQDDILKSDIESS